MKIRTPLTRCAARRGSAVALALVVVTAVAGFSVAFLRITTAAAARQTAEVENLRAFYLAEAGLAESFHGLRYGRSGQIGSQEAPALQGNGLVWVDAVDTPDGQVRLVSTALVGRGRATLSLVVEPVSVPLGFFSNQELVVNDELIVDGFDSEAGAYADQVLGDSLTVEPGVDPNMRDDENENLLFYLGSFYRYYAAQGAPQPTTYWYDAAVDYQVLVESDYYDDKYSLNRDDFLDGPDSDDWDPADEYGAVLEYFSTVPVPEVLAAPAGTVSLYDPQTLDSGILDPLTKQQVGTQSMGVGGLLGGSGGMNTLSNSLQETTTLAVGGTTNAILTLAGPTTGAQGLLGSNQNVRFGTPPGEEVARVFGDVVPGAEGTVEGVANAVVTGATEPRDEVVELESVAVPPVELAMPCRHEGLLPLVVPPGTSGYECIVVAAGAELVLRGPATVVVGELVVEPGGTLHFDTRNGDVSLFVTAGLDLQAGSFTSTTALSAEQVAIQVAEIASTLGEPPVRFDGTSSFHGTIYSPAADVRVGAEFEVFGGIVARTLALAPGARLHFDNAGVEQSPVPRLVSWRLLEVAAAARNLGANPAAALGLDVKKLKPLAEAHELGKVHVKLVYIHKNGQQLTFSGLEKAIDWKNVESVISIERSAERPAASSNDIKTLASDVVNFLKTL